MHLPAYKQRHPNALYRCQDTGKSQCRRPEKQGVPHRYDNLLSAEELPDLFLDVLDLGGITDEVVVAFDDENRRAHQEGHFVEVGRPIFEPSLVSPVNLLEVVEGYPPLLAPCSLPARIRQNTPLQQQSFLYARMRVTPGARRNRKHFIQKDSEGVCRMGKALESVEARGGACPQIDNSIQLEVLKR